nr:MAG TPA: hypothetical protein [Caudoviricetes sp.]
MAYVPAVIVTRGTMAGYSCICEQPPRLIAPTQPSQNSEIGLLYITSTNNISTPEISPSKYYHQSSSPKIRGVPIFSTTFTNPLLVILPPPPYNTNSSYLWL